MPSVFLSYASEDSSLVTRVYNDLNRARVGDVWCYQLTGKYGVNFRKEYSQRVKTAQAFVLFDSEHSRASPYVREEIELCLKTPGIDMLVCLCQPMGPWRKNQVFEGQNEIVFFPFAEYERDIRELCGLFQATYVPRFTVPRDMDFLTEITAAGTAFETKERQTILDKYAFHRSLSHRDPHAAEAQLVVLITEHLAQTNTQVISPFLALGALRNETSRYQDATRAFTEVTRRSPNDPRGWAGLGGAFSQLGQYPESAAAWKNCLRCIEQPGNESHRSFESEVRHNAAFALLKSKDVGGAWQLLAPAVRGSAPQVEHLILAGKILVELRDRQSVAMLTRAATRVSGAERIEADLFVDLADQLRFVDAHHHVGPVLARAIDLYPHDVGIIRQWAIHQNDLRDRATAISLYERALELDPGNVRCLAEMAMLRKYIGKSWQPLVQKCLHANALPPSDEYYLGLAHFLEGRNETVRFHYDRSRRSLVCRDWPYYDVIASGD